MRKWLVLSLALFLGASSVPLPATAVRSGLVNAPVAGAWIDNVVTSNVIVSVPDITCQ
jgi:uncharacterized membrane protein